MELLEHRGASFDALLQDVRHAWRRARRAPVLTLVVVGTLAVGIGANAAIFSVVHALLMRPLPYRDAGRLAFIWGASRGPMGGPDFRALRTESATLSAIGAIWASGTMALTGDGDPEQLRSAFVTTNFFDVLGVEAAFGRTFRREDNLPGAPPTILIGWDLFVRRCGGDPSIVGRQVVVNDEPTTVIGVMPQAFRLLLPPDAAAIGARLPGPGPAGPPFIVVPLQADDVRDVRAPLPALFGGFGILLAIACVNVGGLLVARAAAQAHETSLRVALGASRADGSFASGLPKVCF